MILAFFLLSLSFLLSRVHLQPEKECKLIADVAFIIDKSSSIAHSYEEGKWVDNVTVAKERIKLVKEYIFRIVDILPLSKNQTRATIVAFNYDYNISNTFKKRSSYDNQKFKNLLQRVEYTEYDSIQTTFLGKTLRAVNDTLFGKRSPKRENALKMLIVISDGTSADIGEDEVAGVTSKLREMVNPFIIVAFGIGNVWKQGLEEITGDKKLIFSASSSEEMDGQLVNFLDKICNIDCDMTSRTPWSECTIADNEVFEDQVWRRKVIKAPRIYGQRCYPLEKEVPCTATAIKDKDGWEKFKHEANPLQNFFDPKHPNDDLNSLYKYTKEIDPESSYRGTTKQLVPKKTKLKNAIVTNTSQISAVSTNRENTSSLLNVTSETIINYRHEKLSQNKSKLTLPIEGGIKSSVVDSNNNIKNIDNKVIFEPLHSKKESENTSAKEQSDKVEDITKEETINQKQYDSTLSFNETSKKEFHLDFNEAGLNSIDNNPLDTPTQESPILFNSSFDATFSLQENSEAVNEEQIFERLFTKGCNTSLPKKYLNNISLNVNSSPDLVDARETEGLILSNILTEVCDPVKGGIKERNAILPARENELFVLSQQGDANPTEGTPYHNDIPNDVSQSLGENASKNEDTGFSGSMESLLLNSTDYVNFPETTENTLKSEARASLPASLPLKSKNNVSIFSPKEKNSANSLLVNMIEQDKHDSLKLNNEKHDNIEPKCGVSDSENCDSYHLENRLGVENSSSQGLNSPTISVVNDSELKREALKPSTPIATATQKNFAVVETLANDLFTTAEKTESTGTNRILTIGLATAGAVVFLSALVGGALIMRNRIKNLNSLRAASPNEDFRAWEANINPMYKSSLQSTDNNLIS
ncbi:hypothetical protein Zmor_012214 [Zophobas morio]|jgi:hypothetical protein|uniref:VWFA domain-containing protein n=1 Tax=Zophobas morio TaxID=2755281 RepID=A0AA38LZS8_9CUCU|nr:hypothetical protein Zmor_012214 [Zophobas morio]